MRHMRQHHPRRLFWRLAEWFVLGAELPVVFATAIAAACWAFSEDKAAAGLLLLCVSALAALVWASLPRQRH